MIDLKDFKQLNINITWKMLYRGLIKQQILAEDVIKFAIEKLEDGDDDIDVCELAGTYANERNEVCELLWKLAEQENTEDEIEDRKIRAIIVYNVLKTKNNNFIDGLIDLTDLWASLDFPSDCPHIVQGKDNNISPNEYYTENNYNFMYEKNVEWLRKEIKFLGSPQFNNY